MKKSMLLIISLSMFLVSYVWADITSHPNYQNIRSRKNIITGLIKGQQAAYFAQHGQYFQGLLIPSQAACNGSTEVGIDYGSHPDDQSDSWGTWMPDVFNDDFRTIFNVRVNVVQRLEEHGYEILFSLVKEGLGPDPYGNDGDLWKYRYVYGPLYGSGSITDDWYIEPPEVGP